MGRLISATGAALVAVIVLIGASAAGVASMLFGGGGAGGGCLTAPTAPGAAVAGLTAEQAANAGVIVRKGRAMRIPPHGWVIAVATALQESTLVNLGDLGPDNDHDSLGLFQQRPSQGWGTPEQIMNPDYAAGRFYEALLRVTGWQTLPLTEAAQAVQRSAYPDAYAKHEARATAVVTTYTGGTLPTCDPVAVSAQGWIRPVPGRIVSGYRTADRPGHDGIDLGAPRNTIIRAAAAGMVVRVRCNIGAVSHEPTGAPTRCDQDGYPGLGGCGWYVDIGHPVNIVSRYCHMIKQPAVRVGQSVIAGQPIGLVGSSGNSSGPHVHIEIHTGYPATEGNATEPAAFLRDHGVPI